MSKTDWLADVRAKLPGSYKRIEDIERDRRLKDADRIYLLEGWPAHDDFERGRVAATMQKIRERM